MNIVELENFIYSGGFIRLKRVSNNSELTLISDCVFQNIPITDRQFLELLENGIITRITDYCTDVSTVFYGAAPQQTALTQRDRETFAAILSYWDKGPCALPWHMSYKDVFDLCKKIQTTTTRATCRFHR